MQGVAHATLLLLISLSAVVQTREYGEKRVRFSMRRKEVKNVNQADLVKYSTDGMDKPSIDFLPGGLIPQPSSAGRSGSKGDDVGRIVGGTGASLGDNPWHTLITIDESFICGGSLISNQYVLTAGHCVFKTSTCVVTAGIVDRTALSNGITIISTNKILHPTYDDFYLYNNIALIKLPISFLLGANINLIRLPKQSDATNTFDDSAVTICGFGKKGNYAYPSTLLQNVGLTVTSQVACANTYGTKAIISSMMCTAADEQKSVCGGDFGGGLMYEEADSKKTIIGIASFISRRSCLRYPAVYTRVTSFLGWISNNTGITIRP
ncbi:Hypothetical predicted protein [Cloeon dipterum]|uniref:Peptidase S1 domain-containing protein n=1 Tax=Cloeon dipterum TaxID=197152 RepID=A0A8S1CWK0_9INSE|nr:Hypothetical predicted protein [Cloeon dipterum]